MKNIVHVMLCSQFKCGFGYQENLMTSKQLEQGNKVSVITFRNSNDEASYIDEHGVTIYLLKRTKLSYVPFVEKCVCRTRGLYALLRQLMPDVIFIHQTYAVDYLQIVRFKRNYPSTHIFADNHDDYYNAPVVLFKDIIFRKVIGRFISRRLASVCDKVWGVSPWRVKYLIDVFGVPSKKVDLLVMGGDEKLVRWDERSSTRELIRKKYQIPQNAFLLVAGGKIDMAKNVHLVFEAINILSNPNLYMIVFGSEQEEVSHYCEPFRNANIKELGWINPDDVYPLFIAADLGVFPGTHSVLWEQACASGLPCIFKDWHGGFDHVDCGGNCVLLDDISADSLAKTISELMRDTDKYHQMCERAGIDARQKFSYAVIAKKAIQE